MAFEIDLSAYYKEKSPFSQVWYSLFPMETAFTMKSLFKFNRHFERKAKLKEEITPYPL